MLFLYVPYFLRISHQTDANLRLRFLNESLYEYGRENETGKHQSDAEDRTRLILEAYHTGWVSVAAGRDGIG